MTNVLKNEYHPDYVSPPGETLLETLETIGMSQAELARRMGRPAKTINEIIQGKAAITAETALQLEQVLHIPAPFWLKREQNYREWLARLAKDRRLKGWVEWLKEMPIRVMMQRGWIPDHIDKSQQVLEALKFFGVASPDAWRAIWESKIFSHHGVSIPENSFGAITAWLRQGELEAQDVECAPYNAKTFQDALVCIYALTVEPANISQSELVHLCANAGVAVVFVQEVSYTRICGAAQWLTPTKALIQLTPRYNTDAKLWPTFFRAADHILRQEKRHTFLEVGQKDREEDQSEYINSSPETVC